MDKNKQTLLVVIIAAIIIIFGSSLTGFAPKRTYQCDDHIDNDGDGKCDFAWKNAYCNDGATPGDSDCISKHDNDEWGNCIPTCYSNGDCGTNGYIGDLYCKADGNVYRDNVTYTCENASKCSAVCNQQIISLLWNNCVNYNFTCSNGQCTPQNQTIIFCGDKICSGVETCSTCSQDCGNCPPSGCLTTPDGICPTGCAAGSDYDCCTQAGKCWRPGQGCYDTC